MGKAALITAAVLAALIVAVAATFGYRWLIAPARGAVEEREITNRGQYRIQAYEQFYRWQEELDSIAAKLSAYPEQGLDIRQQTECQGLVARHTEIIAKYNAASRAERTQGQWQDPELPQTLPQYTPRRCQ